MPIFAIRPVPWLTEGSIEFLETFFSKNKNPRILEFGSGASKVWFAKRTSNLVSVEHDINWSKEINEILNKDEFCNKVLYLLRDDPYSGVCDEFEDEYFDFILVDGRDRLQCLEKAIPKLKPGGVLMLDNSEYQKGVFTSSLDEWKFYVSKQIKPDSCGFVYKGWETRWWIKPYNN